MHVLDDDDIIDNLFSSSGCLDSKKMWSFG